MQMELSTTMFERKLKNINSWAFFKRAIEPGTLAERLEISVEDVLNIWEQS